MYKNKLVGRGGAGVTDPEGWGDTIPPTPHFESIFPHFSNIFII